MIRLPTGAISINSWTKARTRRSCFGFWAPTLNTKIRCRIPHKVRVCLGISLSHNRGLSLRNVCCSVKYERAVVAPRCRRWAGGSLFVMCAQRGGSHGQLVCRRNAEFLCQHPLERGRVYGRCGGSYTYLQAHRDVFSSEPGPLNPYPSYHTSAQTIHSPVSPQPTTSQLP